MIDRRLFIPRSPARILVVAELVRFWGVYDRVVRQSHSDFGLSFCVKRIVDGQNAELVGKTGRQNKEQQTAEKQRRKWTGKKRKLELKTPGIPRQEVNRFPVAWVHHGHL